MTQGCQHGYLDLLLWAFPPSVPYTRAATKEHQWLQGSSLTDSAKFLAESHSTNQTLLSWFTFAFPFPLGMAFSNSREAFFSQPHFSVLLDSATSAQNFEVAIALTANGAKWGYSIDPLTNAAAIPSLSLVLAASPALTSSTITSLLRAIPKVPDSPTLSELESMIGSPILMMK